jgi:arylsulfatase A-like enzyme
VLRTNVPRLLLVVCGVLLALLALAPAALARPNVVVILTDDETAAAQQYMTQTNQLIGAQGTVFTQAFATFPLCCPSRTTSLTGQYAHNHGVLHNNRPFGGFTALDHTNTLPVWLQAAGYRTMHVGRYLNGYEYRYGIPPGWDEWYAAPHSSAFNYRTWKVNENGTLHAYPSPARPQEYETDFFARKATELIEGAAGDRPFYLSLWFTAPHRGRPRDPDDPPSPGTPSPDPKYRNAFAGVPLPRPPSFDEANMRDKPQVVADRPRITPEKAAGIQENWQQELETLKSADDAVARVVDALGRTGELADTLVIFESDNGFMHGEHRALAEKVLPYEESIHVPLMMRGPGIPVGHVDDRLVGNIDVVPTILQETGVIPGRLQDGISLIDLLADPGEETGRDILIENGHGANGVPTYRGIRTYRFTYVNHKTTGELELYDLKKDPNELRSEDDNPRYDAVRRDLASRLRRLERCAGITCQAHPQLRLLLRSAGRPVRSCLRRDLRLRVSGPERTKVLDADVLVGSRRIARVRDQPLTERIPHKKLRRHGRFRLRVRAETRDGRLVTLDRTLRACG